MNPFLLIQRMLTHIHVLVNEIGPRGLATGGERRGAEYCRSAFEQLGLSPRLEPFRSAVSIFHPHMQR